MRNSNVPRLKDVAELANVSISAASRILGGDDSRFGKDTVERVNQAAKSLGWRKNLLVNSIQTGQTKTVGVMIPPYDSFWISVLSAIHQRLAKDDYLPITVWLGDLDRAPYFERKAEEGLAQINRLLERRVDALIMWPQIGVNYRQCIADISEQNVPVVVIDQQSPNTIGDTVKTDEVESTRLIAKHLLELGHRRIACIGERDDESHDWSRRRIEYFNAALAETSGTETCFGQLNPTGTDGLEVARKLVNHPSQPTAFFAVSDHLARYIYLAAKELSLSVPSDISVVGFGDLDFSTSMLPPLTTLNQNPKAIGIEAAESVLRSLSLKNRERVDFQEIEVDGQLILRESTGPSKDSANEDPVSRLA